MHISNTLKKRLFNFQLKSVLWSKKGQFPLHRVRLRPNWGSLSEFPCWWRRFGNRHESWSLTKTRGQHDPWAVFHSCIGGYFYSVSASNTTKHAARIQFQRAFCHQIALWSTLEIILCSHAEFWKLDLNGFKSVKSGEKKRTSGKQVVKKTPKLYCVLRILKLVAGHLSKYVQSFTCECYEKKKLHMNNITDDKKNLNKGNQAGTVSPKIRANFLLKSNTSLLINNHINKDKLQREFYIQCLFKSYKTTSSCQLWAWRLF